MFEIIGFIVVLVVCVGAIWSGVMTVLFGSALNDGHAIILGILMIIVALMGFYAAYDNSPFYMGIKNL